MTTDPILRAYPENGPVWVDGCAAHGLWFDRGEFERYRAFVEAGGLSLPPPPHATRSPGRLADDAPQLKF